MGAYLNKLILDTGREKQRAKEFLVGSLKALSFVEVDRDETDRRKKIASVMPGVGLIGGKQIVFTSTFFDGNIWRTILDVPPDTDDAADLDELPAWLIDRAERIAIEGYFDKRPELLKLTITADVMAALEKSVNENPNNFSAGRAKTHGVDLNVPELAELDPRRFDPLMLTAPAPGALTAGLTIRRARFFFSVKTGFYHFLEIHD